MEGISLNFEAEEENNEIEAEEENHEVQVE